MAYVLVGLAAFLTWFSSKRPNILLGMSTALLWFALSLWGFFSTEPVFPLDEIYSDILYYVFLMLTFLPLLLQMDTEIKNEKDGHSWSTWGDKPEGQAPTAYEEYRKLLFNKTRRR